MIRKIIQIDESKCNGCGACALACHEGAIGMVNGKARLLRDDYCDGLGDCLPACPAGAITFTEREAAPYNENAAAKAKGIRFGRVPKPLPENFHAVYQRWKSGEITGTAAAKECGMPLSTFRYRAKIYEKAKLL